MLKINKICLKYILKMFISIKIAAHLLHFDGQPLCVFSAAPPSDGPPQQGLDRDDGHDQHQDGGGAHPHQGVVAAVEVFGTLLRGSAAQEWEHKSEKKKKFFKVHGNDD
jgi:hypothetical protein